ncbi:MAG: DNA-directed RNA polymerase subunit alpha [Candidatus Kapaibacteriota bacterium]
MNYQIQMPDRVIVEQTSSENHGRFILQPLEQGYGVTIGNAFRRVLLSSIVGSAIVGVKFSNVLHEFETIQGVKEDVAEIILNLKEVRFKLIDKKIQRIAFRLKGPGVWTARDIQEASSLIEIMNLDHQIATLETDADFDVELRIGRGKGYVPADEQQIFDFPVGMLPIDSIFTPIKNVIYNIEPFRVGQKTDYEKLILDVRTDGTVTPDDAIHQAALILRDHIKLFIDFDFQIEQQEEEIKKTIEDSTQSENKKIKQILLTPVEELELSVRAHNCLKGANIKHVFELVRMEHADLLKFRNFGKKSLTELGDVIHSLGLEFGMDVEKYLKENPKPQF